MSGRPPGWALAVVRLAAGFIEAGEVRTRYAAELESELWGLSRSQQLAYAARVLLSAPALHRALWDTGQVTHPHSVWWCRGQLHHRWHTESAEDGTRFERCRACGTDNDGTMQSPVAASSWMEGMTRS